MPKRKTLGVFAREALGRKGNRGCTLTGEGGAERELRARFRPISPCHDGANGRPWPVAPRRQTALFGPLTLPQVVNPKPSAGHLAILSRWIAPQPASPKLCSFMHRGPAGPSSGVGDHGSAE